MPVESPESPEQEKVYALARVVSTDRYATYDEAEVALEVANDENLIIVEVPE